MHYCSGWVIRLFPSTGAAKKSGYRKGRKKSRKKRKKIDLHLMNCKLSHRFLYHLFLNSFSAVDAKKELQQNCIVFIAQKKGKVSPL